MVIDGVDEVKVEAMKVDAKKKMKRKRVNLVIYSPEEKSAKIEELKVEMKGLVEYYKEVMEKKVVQMEEMKGLGSGLGLNSVIGCMLEESDLSLSKLVDVIFEKISDSEGSSSKVSVKSAVILVGQRVFYGVPNGDVDVLEDESESALWCWEVKFFKFVL